MQRKFALVAPGYYAILAEPSLSPDERPARVSAAAGSARRYLCQPMKFATKAIHAGVHPDPETGAIMTPIYQTSTYAQRSPGDNKGYEYSRTHNPTRTQLQDALAALDGGEHGLAFASGMAAIDCVLRLLKPGDEVISTDDLYGGSYRIMTKVYEPLGIVFHFVPMGDLATVREKVTAHTKLIWVETPTNPLLNIIDIAGVAAIAKEAGALLAVDNTFSTPYLQEPLALGADIVVYSLTKYMGGHSDVVMGALVFNGDELLKQLSFYQNACGGTPGPQDCFLVLRGLKTLHLRMQRHCENGRAIAEYLRQHPAWKSVLAGLRNPPQPRGGRPPDARLRGHDFVRAQGRPEGGCHRGARKIPALHPGRKSGRRGKPERPPRHHDPRQYSARAAPQGRPLRLAYPPERRRGRRGGLD